MSTDFQKFIRVPTQGDDIPAPGGEIVSIHHWVGREAFNALSTAISEVGDYQNVSHLSSSTSADTIIDSSTLSGPPSEPINFSDFSILSARLDLIHSECICYSDCQKFKYWKQLNCTCNYDCGCYY